MWPRRSASRSTRFSRGILRSSWPRFPSSTRRSARSATRNKLYYRFNHWPIWIFVFFIAPGPLTFDLFERGFDARMATWLGAGARGHGDRRPARPAARLRAGALHHPLHRRSAESALSPRLLHDGVERGRDIRRAQHRGPRLGDRQRRLGAETDLSGCVLSDRRHDLAARRARPAAAREGVHEGRRARAAVLLRVGVGGVLGAAGALVPLEGAARVTPAATRSSSRSSSASSRSSATSRGSAACRARGPSFQASSRCLISERVGLRA